MADPFSNDFVPPEMRKLAEQSVQQARKAFDDLMEATKRAVSTFESNATTSRDSVVELQRKVVGYSERNVRASLEFAQKLVTARQPDDLIKLHSEFVQSQIQALQQQAQDLAAQVSRTAKTPG